MIEINVGSNIKLVNFNPLSLFIPGGILKHSSPLAILFAAAAAISGAAQAQIAPDRQAEILYLLKHDCGSCHGMRLEGGLGPALTAERLNAWESDLLAVTILYGRPGTPMPPWRPFLTDSEALWLAARLKEGIRP